MSLASWHIGRTGRAWTHEEFETGYFALPEKMEVSEGKLFWSEEDRLNMLGLVLINVGVDRAIRLGDPRVWQAAIAELNAPAPGESSPQEA